LSIKVSSINRISKTKSNTDNLHFIRQNHQMKLSWTQHQRKQM